MTSVLQIKLREVLREDLGGTYGVWVGGSGSHYPDEQYRISINMDRYVRVVLYPEEN